MKIISKDEAREFKLKRYFTGKPCKNNHISERLTSTSNCCECMRERAQTKEEKSRCLAKSKKKYHEDPVAAREYAKKMRQSEEYKIRVKEYLSSERVIEMRKAWYSDPKNKANNAKVRKEHWTKPGKLDERKRKLREYHKRPETIAKVREYRNRKEVKAKKKIADKKWYTESNYKARPEVMFTSFIRLAMKRIGTYKRGSRKKYEEILGYTKKEFIDHIESQFVGGMNWENRGDFHIDHIKPIKAFIDEGVNDIKIINALSNLQPLWAKDNLTKGSKY